MMKEYRNNGSIGAILDEYEKALTEMEYLITDLKNEDLAFIVDNKTDDSDCKSIQTILTHVIRAGYNYVIEIRKSFGEKIDFIEHKTFKTAEEYALELKKMFEYNEKLFKDYPNLNFEAYKSERKILTKWGQLYDIEQLYEHAIVHVLRHRRQIEKFIITLN
ncbi:DinB family protein [Thalassobellus citreus]|uniref:DinB family protein n=1 Tax=Thalassobellus citreus TaxID=3367752 RepID=UPI00378EC0F1